MGTFIDGESGSSVRTKINAAIEKTEGTSAISTIDVDGGAIDGVTIGTNSAVTDLRVDNLQLDGNTVSSTNLNGDVNISPNGTGTVVINTDLDVDNININGNAITSTDTNGNVTITPNGTGKTATTNLTYNEVQYASLGTTGTLTPDPANGSVQKITLTGNITINALGGTPAAGDSVTLVIVQPASGNYTLTSTMKFAGGTKTLSTTSNYIDVLTIYYDGTNYLANLATNFS
jgi:hypothetical protein